MKHYITSLFFLIILSNLLYGQQDIRYDKICYCSGNETPHVVVSLDNNIAILLALRNGGTKADLKRDGIPYTDSQLKLLQMFNLIEKKDGKYITKIQILDSLQTFELRKHTKRVANKIFLLIEPETKELVKYLNSSYNSKNAFSILFSYVFDGLIWREFENLEIIRPMQPDDNTLTWVGHFWMIPFPRDSRCGTNSSTEKQTTIYITNGVPWRFMEPLYEKDDLMNQMLLDINAFGKIQSTDVISAFSDYSLFDNNGIVQVPIIVENSDNRIFELANVLSKKLSNEFLKEVSISEIVNKYSFIDKETALIIFYHEFMWDLMKLIEDNKIVSRPKILINSSNSSLSDMSDLIFFVVEK